MAERRMISKKIIESDRFSSLPDKARVLYIYLLLAADDDGFIANSKIVMHLCGSNAKSLNTLIIHGFVIKFGTGVLAITHWSAQNKVAKDRYTPTVFTRERDSLILSNSGTYIAKGNFPLSSVLDCNT